MVNPASLRTDFDSVVKEVGEVVRIRYFGMSGATTGYDDDVTLTKSGTDLFISGVVQPVGEGLKYSSEVALVQQGLLLNDDIKLYLTASGAFSLTSGTYRIGRGGSPTPANEYGKAIENGVITHVVGGSEIYHKVFLRRLSTGSLMGEG